MSIRATHAAEETETYQENAATNYAKLTKERTSESDCNKWKKK